ncbi:hypothetical protein, partial [Pantoea agglomerans]|uniref:hypothetical protein n=1 Tax=Enterobacter agglomerans TaxID=549 RepID=UPI003C7D9B14
GANPPLRDIPVARPEIPHPLSGSDGLPTPLLLSLLFYGRFAVAVSFRDCLRYQTIRQHGNSEMKR